LAHCCLLLAARNIAIQVPNQNLKALGDAFARKDETGPQKAKEKIIQARSRPHRHSFASRWGGGLVSTVKVGIERKATNNSATEKAA
jgi:hypothetical protein